MWYKKMKRFKVKKSTGEGPGLFLWGVRQNRRENPERQESKEPKLDTRGPLRKPGEEKQKLMGLRLVPRTYGYKTTRKDKGTKTWERKKTGIHHRVKKIISSGRGS